MSVAAAPSAACVFDEADVALARPLTLLHELPPPAARRRLALGPGVWNLYPAPDARGGPSAAIDLPPGEAVWLLEEGPARWARVLWTTDTAAVVGWVDRSGRGQNSPTHVACPGGGQLGYRPT